MPEKKQKPQLHQLLAVETDRKNQANLILAEAVTTFSKKADHFDGIIKSYQVKLEGSIEIPAEIKEVVTTVKEKVAYAAEKITKGIDAQLSKEETNNGGCAKAIVSIGSEDIELSATSLLALEKNLEKIRELYKEIPTLDPARVWDLDSKSGRNIYRTSPEIKFRTEKKQVALTLAPATKEHPAQVQLVSEDKQVGQYETIYTSGRITPRQKADLIERIESLLDKVKRARAKANQAEVIDVKIGKKIFDHINGGIL